MEAKSLEALPPLRLSVRRQLVEPDEAGLRLDRYLADHNPGAPISLIQRWLRTGQTRVNGGRARGGYRLQTGEEVRLPPFSPEPPSDVVSVPEWAIKTMKEAIIWQDQQVLILNKPHKIPVHGGSGQQWGCVDAVRALFEREGHKEVPELCHRLDKETSGCLMFALEKTALRRLSEAFRLGQIDKEYLVLVRGTPKVDSGLIDQPLIKGNLQGGERMVVTSEHEGQAARTRYQRLKQYATCALLAIFLDTGRTHQIRVHMQWLGHPIAGDEKYGDVEFNRAMRKTGLNRMFLHAQFIQFTHPISGEKLRIEAPLDPILTKTLKTADNTLSTK